MRFTQFLAEKKAAEAKKKKFEPPKPLTPAQEKARRDKKITGIKNLASNIRRLRDKLTRDLSSDNERTVLIALAVSFMIKCYERVGNDTSAEEGHFGITGLQPRHVTARNGVITLKYTGKSGVDQEKTIKDARLSVLVKKYMKGKGPKDRIFKTENGVKISSEKINAYLKSFDITAKDIRGHAANDLMIKSLKRNGTPKDENDRKKKFLELLKKVAEMVGHTSATLRKHYLVPKIEDSYLKTGKVEKINSL